MQGAENETPSRPAGDRVGGRLASGGSRDAPRGRAIDVDWAQWLAEGRRDSEKSGLVGNRPLCLVVGQKSPAATTVPPPSRQA
jgi:hypothetical protein